MTTENEAREKEVKRLTELVGEMFYARSTRPLFALAEGKIYHKRVAIWLLSKLNEAGYRLIPELTLIDDEEFVECEVEYAKENSLHFPLGGEARDICNREAQLSHTKKQLNPE